MTITSPFTPRVGAQNAPYENGQVPGRFSGGGQRSNCPATQYPLIALAPFTQDGTFNPPAIYVGSVTVAEHPTFWFYVPYSLSESLTAEFVLRDAVGRVLYQTKLSQMTAFEQASHLVSISVLDTETPLSIGQVYRWSFKVNCASEVPIYVNGGIKRISATTDTNPESSFDRIHALGSQWRSNPNDPIVAAQWNSLVQSFISAAEQLSQPPFERVNQ
ncbi:DUF928 domain-containing protein [Leptolyngbya sp. FACHB-711]|uniref:DUF928 domain-containing protein n=1 Tax=Leptolyngbya sp. FACHB-711 TaxID=2692813 RepID=UPI001682A7C6|nr:DUF928 domain-containing protein [Leptolyngbya sp. FACHB-711]MBD2027001.1 DUF928 domain-containing protein [Leptolyngbya sp. FACHB-711]